MEKVFEIYIRTTPERLWEAITDPEIHSKYQFGTQSSRTGDRLRYKLVNPRAGTCSAKG